MRMKYFWAACKVGLGEVHKFHHIAVIQRNVYLGISIQDEYLYNAKRYFFQMLTQIVFERSTAGLSLKLCDEPKSWLIR